MPDSIEAINDGRLIVYLGPNHGATPGGTIENAFHALRVLELVGEDSVLARPERWHERLRAWLREYVGRDRNALPFPHTVEGDRMRVRLPPGHGGEIGGIIKPKCGRWRWRAFRIVAVPDEGSLLIRRRRWYDGIASRIWYASEPGGALKPNNLDEG